MNKQDLGLSPDTKTTIKTESPTKVSKELQELMRLHQLAENLPALGHVPPEQRTPVLQPLA
jgi:hypothetical protein